MHQEGGDPKCRPSADSNHYLYTFALAYTAIQPTAKKIMEDAPDEDIWGLDDTQSERRTLRQDIITLLSRRIVRTIKDKAEKPIEDVKQALPSSSNEVRSLPFYGSILEAITYQRDNYLVGNQYADTRQKARSNHNNPRPPPLHRIPYDPRALGSIQLASLGASFIPSPTVHNALLPLLVSLPSGVLKEPIANAVANAIPLAQPQLDLAMKNSIIAFMGNPKMRQVIKNRAGGYMSTRDT